VKVLARKAVVSELVSVHGLSERRGCLLAGVHRSTQRYRRRREEPEGLRQRLRELAAERSRFGYRRLHVLLVRAGWQVNRKRVLRMYQEEGLQVRRKRRKQAARASRMPRVVPHQPNESWSMDFMSDSLADGRVFRLLNIVDDCTRESPAMVVAFSITGQRVVRELERLRLVRGLPARITVDNGPEFTSRALDAWAYEHGVELRFIRPGKPVENSYVESFNGRVREECLNQHCFADLEMARRLVEGWRVDYNEVRPHSSLGNRTPREEAARLGEGYPSPSPGQAAACRDTTTLEPLKT